MESSNPALAKLTPSSTNTYGEPGWYQPGAGGSAYPGVMTRSDAMTVDGVIGRTLALLALMTLSGAAAWIWLPPELTGVALIGGAIGALVLGLVISFGRMTNPLLVTGYALLEGVVLGLISEVFENQFAGIVAQAVAATVGIFFVMLILYRFRVIRATPRFTKGLMGALIAAVVLMLGNWVLSLFGVNTGLRDAGAIGIIFSLAMIVIGALTFILDFDVVERGVAEGLPKRYGWFAAFGILLGLVWVYLEVLRLLSYLRGRE
ncbi:MAG: Bax inhibitor-1/YccA family protein [Hamadaea sp.]|nr:Bax inhibitor-1/YccA family protein [Hamadaea sp.]